MKLSQEGDLSVCPQVHTKSPNHSRSPQDLTDRYLAPSARKTGRQKSNAKYEDLEAERVAIAARDGTCSKEKAAAIRVIVRVLADFF